MDKSLGKKTASGFLWSFLEKVGGMGLQFGVNIAMTRLLLPSDFGAVGVLEIFIAVSQTLMDGGLTSALIQKKNPSEKDYSSVFFFNVALALLLYLALFISAPFIAQYYHIPSLTLLVRALSVIIITSALGVVQINILKKQLNFRTIALVNIIAYGIASPFAIYAAAKGYGPWALIILMVGNSALATAIFWCRTRWRPSAVFSLESLKGLFAFGGYFLGANILQDIARNLQGVIIGRRFSTVQMGLYSQAYKLDRISSYTLPQIIVQVLYPVYSSLQDDREEFARMLKSSVRIVAFIIFPLMGALILTAKDVIYILYGERWMAVVPYFRILCVAGFFVCLQNVTFYAVAAQGKSRQLFLWSFYKWGFLIAILCASMFLGMEALLWGMAISAFNIYMVNAVLASRYTDYKLHSQLLDILKIFIPVAASLGVASLTSPSLHPWSMDPQIPVPSLIISFPVFLACYLLFSYLLKSEPLQEIKTIAKRSLK